MKQGIDILPVCGLSRAGYRPAIWPAATVVMCSGDKQPLAKEIVMGKSKDKGKKEKKKPKKS
ncbi:hypothetical protein C3F09_06775 [candidate division GN15 bacterium]|uniref:Uncharacterized protein n=1 Tax=candidate division GN15 bacterium TaxID=2072418 RepID=A0A855X1F0_9BACT|nr:MAG: hypothetical protein C3F09_06775 [candidate division GN15 bacterium]